MFLLGLVVLGILCCYRRFLCVYVCVCCVSGSFSCWCIVVWWMMCRVYLSLCGGVFGFFVCAALFYMVLWGSVDDRGRYLVLRDCQFFLTFLGFFSLCDITEFVYCETPDWLCFVAFLFWLVIYFAFCLVWVCLFCFVVMLKLLSCNFLLGCYLICGFVC